MEGYRTVLRSLGLLGLVMLTGSSCAWLNAPPRYALPRALPPSPTLEQVIGAVNNNSKQVYSFSTDQARISVPGSPSLCAAIAFERPMRLRLRAGTTLMGPELDVGSNDDVFWIWIRRQPPLYYCRHDQVAASPVRHMLPIEPEWLIEALGLPEFEPALPHQGPYLQPGGSLEIRTVRETADGPTTKLTIVDRTTGVVLAQHVYDSQRRLVASAVASQHRRDPFSGLIMPGVVEIQCPGAQLSMRLDLGNVEINRPLGNPAALWSMPTFDGSPMVDLGNPNLRFGPVRPPDTVSLRSQPPRSGWRPSSR